MDYIFILNKLNLGKDFVNFGIKNIFFGKVKFLIFISFKYINKLNKMNKQSGKKKKQTNERKKLI